MKERCVKERGGSGGGGTAVCVAEVHNWHALESCGLALGGRSLELKQGCRRRNVTTLQHELCHRLTMSTTWINRGTVFNLYITY